MTADPDAVPQVSVLLPVLDGAAVIGGQLRALSRQDFTGSWEVVVGDNGSQDATREVIEAWRSRLPELTVVDASYRPGVNVARNAAAAAARGDLLLFTDADDEVDPSWITAMVAVLATTPLACGVAQIIDEEGREHSLSMAEGPPTALGFLPYGLGANLGTRRELFDRVGGFEDGWPVVGADDIDFCWRAQLSGAQLGFSDSVRIRYRQPTRALPLFAKQRGYGRGTVVLGRRFAAQGAQPSSWSYVARNAAALVRDLPWLFTPRRRSAWVKRAGFVGGVAEELLRRTEVEAGPPGGVA